MEPQLGTILEDKNPRQPATGRLLHWKWQHLDLLGLTMDKNIHALFEEFRNTPFPELGKVVGDFALYDSLLAGTVSSFLAGAKVDLEAVPVPDQETEATLSALEKKNTLDRQEADFRK